MRKIDPLQQCALHVHTSSCSIEIYLFKYQMAYSIATVNTCYISAGKKCPVKERSFILFLVFVITLWSRNKWSSARERDWRSSHYSSSFRKRFRKGREKLIKRSPISLLSKEETEATETGMAATTILTTRGGSDFINFKVSERRALLQQLFGFSETKRGSNKKVTTNYTKKTKKHRN